MLKLLENAECKSGALSVGIRKRQATLAFFLLPDRLDVSFHPNYSTSFLIQKQRREERIGTYSCAGRFCFTCLSLGVSIWLARKVQRRGFVRRRSFLLLLHWVILIISSDFTVVALQWIHFGSGTCEVICSQGIPRQLTLVLTKRARGGFQFQALRNRMPKIWLTTKEKNDVEPEAVGVADDVVNTIES